MPKNSEALFFRLVDEATREILTRTIAEKGSCQAAAEHLGISPTTITRYLKRAGTDGLQVKAEVRRARKEKQARTKRAKARAGAKPAAKPQPRPTSWLSEVAERPLSTTAEDW